VAINTNATQSVTVVMADCSVLFDSYNIVGDIVLPDIPTGPEAEKQFEVKM